MLETISQKAALNRLSRFCLPKGVCILNEALAGILTTDGINRELNEIPVQKIIINGHPMKKTLFIALTLPLLAGCQDKTQYEQTVLEQMQQEQDITDYKLDPERMTSCVVELSSKNMPGVFTYDPKRLETFRSYSKMLTLKTAEHPEQVMAELRTEFGSAKGLADAHRNYTESVMNCLSALIMESEEQNKPKEPKEAAAK